jgi:hypothetical protein
MTTSPYVDYYANQAGFGSASALKNIYPEYFMTKTTSQKGRGIGSLLRSIVKIASPLVKRGAKVVGKTALRTGSQILSDVASGANLKEAARARSLQNLAELRDSTISQLIGKKRKRNTTTTKVKKRKRLII